MESFSSNLRVGQRVYAGFTELGQVDHTGHIVGSPGDHLHITFSIDNTYSSNSLREYFNYTDNPPGPQFFNDAGC
jgi:murein DD-endopeptidase MepM/ murein hydrolase activator NlpD